MMMMMSFLTAHDSIDLNASGAEGSQIEQNRERHSN